MYTEIPPAITRPKVCHSNAFTMCYRNKLWNCLVESEIWKSRERFLQLHRHSRQHPICPFRALGWPSLPWASHSRQLGVPKHWWCLRLTIDKLSLYLWGYFSGVSQVHFGFAATVKKSWSFFRYCCSCVHLLQTRKSILLKPRIPKGIQGLGSPGIYVSLGPEHLPRPSVFFLFKDFIYLKCRVTYRDKRKFCML